MAASQVVLCFDKQEDALLFALAASSLMSEEGPAPIGKAAATVAEKIRKATRIKTQVVTKIT